MTKFKHRQQELLAKAQGAPKKKKTKKEKKKELKKAREEKKMMKRNPDRASPVWLFPSAESTPLSILKPRTKEELEKEEAERRRAFEYMRHRVHAGPARPPPPPQLLTLVGMFLSEFGFVCTSRLFDNECEALQELSGWKETIGEQIEKGMPTLADIYEQWNRELWVKQKDYRSTQSEAKCNSMGESEVRSAKNGSSGSDKAVSVDVEMSDAPKVPKNKAQKKVKSVKSSSSSSDSDADDENEQVKPKVATASEKVDRKPKAAVEKATGDAEKPKDSAWPNTLKRKALDSPSEPTAEQPVPKKKARTATAKSSEATQALPNGTSKKSGFAALPDETDSSSSSSSSDEEKSKMNGAKVKPVNKPTTNGATTTINGLNKKGDNTPNTSSDSTNSDAFPDEAPAPPVHARKVKNEHQIRQDDQEEAPKKPKKKHAGAKPTPLALASADPTATANTVSNEYQSYEYADKAYKDLSVTRGKGFTKEKNKKKRGSYRGGTIDTSGGGKGFKFED